MADEKTFVQNISPEGEQPSAKTALLQAAEPLLEDWFRENGRSLPWRQGRNAYRMWVSEIMLQQTRIEAVTEHYRRFMEEFPTVTALARAPQERVLKSWEGLGYYSRARHLQETAAICVRDYGGELPGSFAELRRLPGIGAYTAGAIASMAFDENVPAVDGNVLRVLARLLLDSRNVLDDKLRQEAGERIQSLEKTSPGCFNEALMELGETVCLPTGKPLCEKCPVKDLCLAHREGREEALPVREKNSGRRKEHYFALIFRCGDKLALEKRPDRGLLAGLYGFPLLPWCEKNFEEALKNAYPALQSMQYAVTDLGSYRHLFTHIEWNLEGREIRTEEEVPGLLYVTAAQQQESCSVPSAFRPFLPDT